MHAYLDCISVENMRESDRLTIENYVSGRTLMYRAAMGVYRSALWEGNIVIAVGGGNNGGDGYALACILADNNIKCRIVKLSDKLTDDSSYFAERSEKSGGKAYDYFKGAFKDSDIIVDCLLGTGFRGTLREPWLSAVQEINDSNAEVISVDINSGMNGDTGDAENAVKSDLTVTVGYVKQGLVSYNAGKFIKRLVTADIGIVLSKSEYKIYFESEYMNNDANIIKAPKWLEREVIDVSSIELPYM